MKRQKRVTQVKMAASAARKARANHLCWGCEGLIEKGSTYRCDTLEMDGTDDLTHARTHLGCEWDPEQNHYELVREFTGDKKLDLTRT